MGSVDAFERLGEHRRGWDEKPLLRELYLGWFKKMAGHLRPGLSVELGSGPGRLADHVEGMIATDVVQVPWVDVVLDATRLPFREDSVDNLVMLDVFHHLEPAVFLDEAARVLVSGGRVVMVEPYVSPFSQLVYRFIHEEPTRMSADPFSGDPTGAENPFDGNQALPTLAFWRNESRFRRRWPALSVRHKELFSFFLYPLSGGYGYPALIPRRCIPVGRWLERRLFPLRRLLAFRTLVVLEKQ